MTVLLHFGFNLTIIKMNHFFLSITLSEKCSSMYSFDPCNMFILILWFLVCGFYNLYFFFWYFFYFWSMLTTCKHCSCLRLCSFISEAFIFSMLSLTCNHLSYVIACLFFIQSRSALTISFFLSVSPSDNLFWCWHYFFTANVSM